MATTVYGYVTVCPYNQIEERLKFAGDITYYYESDRSFDVYDHGKVGIQVH